MSYKDLISRLNVLLLQVIEKLIVNIDLPKFPLVISRGTGVVVGGSDEKIT